ncbi:MAG: hypothetical protein JXA42_09815 [Anaerolineales bacterium]|nr:hypothetical protein [Anaerolineales bacterium]
MTTSIVVVMVSLGFLLILIGSYFIFFSPSARQNWAIRKQAKLDYENARGTAHLEMLKDAQRRIEKETKQQRKYLTAERNKLSKIVQERNTKLRRILERHIAYTYLDQVHGVGPVLKDRILKAVFRNSIKDLRRASIVQGVGEEKQWAINNWIRTYEVRIPTLLEGPFPGKESIVKQYTQSIGNARTAIESIQKRIAELEITRDQISGAIEPLQEIKVKDFIRALQQPSSKSEEIDYFFRGVFAEWEPIPDWFMNVIAQETD